MGSLLVKQMNNPTKFHRQHRTSIELSAGDISLLEAVLDRLSRCSRHRLLLACVRIGLEHATRDPALVARYVSRATPIGAP